MLRTVASCTRQCRERFEDCLEASDAANNEWVTNRLADFDLWADGIGAALEHHGSLDHRLRDRADIRGIVLELMESLRDTLQEYVNECEANYKSTRPDSSDEQTGDSDRGTKLSAPSTSFSDVSKRITRLMDQLNRLSMAIRRSGNVIRYQKADRSLKLDAYADFVDYLHFFLARKIEDYEGEEKAKRSLLADLPLDLEPPKKIITTEVRQRLKETHPVILSMQDRLIRINVKRRNRIIYARDHSKRMAGDYSNQATNLIYSQTQEASASGGLRLPQGNSLERRNEPQNQKPLEKPTRTVLASSATGVGSQLAAHSQPRSSAAPTKITITGAKADFPTPPQRPHDASFFQCPYCYITLDKKYGEKERWSSHVKEDLQPYSCVYDKCPKADESYGTVGTWMHHMELEHAEKVWKCFLCDLDQPVSFPTGAALKYHLQNDHDSENDFTESQLPMLVDKSLRSQPLVIERCPICTRCNNALSDKFAHVAEELLEFALEALPWGGDFLDASARSQSRRSSSNIPANDRADQNGPDLPVSELSHLGSGDSMKVRDTFGSGEIRRFMEGVSILNASKVDREFFVQGWLKGLGSQEGYKIEDWAIPAASSAVNDFLIWVDSSLAQRPGFRVSNEKTELYVADSELQSFFSKPGRLDQLLHEVSPAFRNHKLDIDKLRQLYLKMFATILVGGKGHMIDILVNHHNVRDHPFPILDFPEVAGESTEHLRRLFKKYQWRFCVRKLTYGMEAELLEEEILPIKYKEELGRGGYATTFKIQVEEEYNDLESDESRRRASRKDHNTFVLKTYRNQAHIYQNEITAYKILMQNSESHSNIVDMLGSFVQGNRFSMIFGYCDRGTLDDYMAQTARPSGDVEVKAFWGGFLGLAKGLASIHDVAQKDPVHGWHQDIKPANILVFSIPGEAYPGCHFKIADLGVSHFKKAEFPQVDILDRDSYGIYAYGAPETYRSDSEVGLKELLVSRAVDIWSFGCVCSEVAVWVTYGWNRVLEYRDQRRLQARKRLGIRAGDLFHDGKDSTSLIVDAYHEQVLEDSQASDNLTGEVLRRLILPMLQRPLLRPTAMDTVDRSNQVVRESSIKSNSVDDRHANVGSVEFKAENPDHKIATRTSGKTRETVTRSPSTEYSAPTKRSLAQYEEEGGSIGGWVWDSVPHYRLTYEIVHKFLVQTFGRYNTFHVERSSDVIRFWVPRKLTRGEKDRLIDEGLDE